MKRVILWVFQVSKISSLNLWNRQKVDFMGHLFMLNNMDPFVITQNDELNGYFTTKHCALKKSHWHSMVI